MSECFAGLWRFLTLEEEEKKFVYKTPPKRHFEALGEISPYWGFKYFAGDKELSSHDCPAIYFRDGIFNVVGRDVDMECPTLAHAVIEYQDNFKKHCDDAEANWLKKNKMLK